MIGMDNRNQLYNSIFRSLTEIIKIEYKSIVIWLTSFGVKSTVLEVHVKNKSSLWVSAFRVKCNKDDLIRTLNEISIKLNADRAIDNWKTAVLVLDENNSVTVKYFYEDIADNERKVSDILKSRYLV